MKIEFETIMNFIAAITASLVLYNNIKAATKEKIKVKLNVILGIAFLLAFIYSVYSVILKTTIELNSPIYCENVENITTVQGRAKYIPKKEVLWIIVYSHKANRYYPQANNPVIILENGDWTSQATIGGVKERSDICAVLADEKAQTTLKNYIDLCEDTGVWPGIKILPEGTEIYDKVTVVRK